MQLEREGKICKREAESEKERDGDAEKERNVVRE